jgi:LPS export ABC transporter protein LptC
MKWYFVGALCVMAVVLTLESRLQFSFLGRSEKSEYTDALLNDDPPGMWVQDVFVIEQATAEQSKSWELFAKEIAFYDARRLALVKQLQAEFFPHDVETLHLTAERGQINSSTGDMTVEGRVLLRPLWGYALETAVLHWDAADRTLRTDAEVRISAEAIDIVGTGFSGSVDQQRFALQQQVRVSFHQPKP